MKDKLLNAAEIAVKECMDLQNGETVLIINNKPNRDVAIALKQASEAVTDTVYQIEYPVGDESGEEPPEFVAKLMSEVDCVFAPTQKSISHTDARREANEVGTRCATLPGITNEEFSKGLDTDYNQIKENCHKIYESVKDADEIRVITEKGTDVTFKIGRQWMIDDGDVSNKGDFTNLPAGEVFTSPIDANGTVIVDGTASPIGVLGDDSIKFELSDGKLASLESEILREKYTEAEEKAGTEVYNVAEFAIGANNGVSNLIGSILTDEKAAGTFHFAIGDDSSFGGNTSVPIHLDYVVKDPRIFVDGKEIDIHF